MQYIAPGKSHGNKMPKGDADRQIKEILVEMILEAIR